jgi:hypothetical protein
MTDHEREHWSPERSIGGIAEDRLGHRVFAAHVANAILAQPLGEGLTLGIVGPWGCGKSGIINLITQVLCGDQPGGDRILAKGKPLILRFNPWIVGKRSALLPEYFSVLNHGFESLDNPGERLNEAAMKTIRRVRAELLKYAQLLEAAGRALPVIELTFAAHGVPARGLITALGTGIRTTLAMLKASLPSVETQKDRVVKLLRASPRRIVVVIDDLDRLEPAEAVEVLRLVKAVADFPNVFYLVAYDAALLQHAVEHHLQVPDGHAFLEKLVQIEYAVPLPDDFDLRGWFRKDIDRIVAGADGIDRHRTDDTRLSALISSQGGMLLKTPRDVVRTVNAFRSGWLPVKRQVDVADFVWVTLTKVKRPELYEWLREYAQEAAHHELGAAVDAQVEHDLVRRLCAMFPEDDRRQLELKLMNEMFPAIAKTARDNNSGLRLFDNNAGNRARSRADRRIASGHYSRFYFAPTPAAGSFTPDDEEKLDGILEDRAAIGNFIVAMSAQRRPQGSNMGAYTVDSLVQRFDALSPSQRRAILLALGDIMDKVVMGQDPDEFAEWRIWEIATLFLDAVFGTEVDNLERELLMQELIGKGPALEWLMRSVSRLSSGKARRANTGVEAPDLSRAVEILLQRLQTDVPLDTLPYLLDFLWSWRRLGDENGPRLYADRHTVAQDEFLAVMMGLRSWPYSDKAYRPINRPDTEPFLDGDAARQRLELIAGNGGAGAELASELLQDMRIGDSNYREGQETFFADGSDKRYSPTPT